MKLTRVNMQHLVAVDLPWVVRLTGGGKVFGAFPTIETAEIYLRADPAKSSMEIVNVTETRFP